MTTHAPSGTVPGLQVIGNKADTEAGDSLAARTLVPVSNVVEDG